MAPKKNIVRRPEKNHADKSVGKKKICALKKFHPPSGYFYFPLLNYHVAVMTEVFSLGANQESERLRPFGTGSVEQCSIIFISWTPFSFARLQFSYLHWPSEDGF